MSLIPVGGAERGGVDSFLVEENGGVEAVIVLDLLAGHLRL